MNDDTYGAIASQLGFDALTAADQNLILSSASPLLKIDKEFLVTKNITASTTNLLVTHNYGYPCFFVAYVLNSDVAINEFLLYLRVDSQSIYLDAPFGTSGNMTFKILTCRNPITKEVTSPTFRTVSREVARQDINYGLIVSKDGKSTDSTDLRDFNFHSSTRNLLIHRVMAKQMYTPYNENVPGSTGYGIYWKNDLPYRPIYYAFASIDGGASYRLLYGNEQAVPGVRQETNGDIRVDGAENWYASIFVFKDPIDPGNTKVVTI